MLISKRAAGRQACRKGDQVSLQQKAWSYWVIGLEKKVHIHEIVSKKSLNIDDEARKGLF